MAGQFRSILPKRVYDFTNLALGASQQLIVAQRIDVSKYIDCMLAVRTHAASFAGGNGVNLDVYGDGYTGDEPGKTFLTATPLFSSPLLQNASSITTPYGGTVRGTYVALVLTATKPSAGSCSITMSADMILRSPDTEE